ncbi:MAG: flavin reductase family protein [Nitrospinota bacterium]|jgi:flavin reductase (DIM6/NTAB) family NADH-FMN oxidoreductase RutF|nr:flavin reductase [Nitrospinota bacterium]MDP6365188.1 flavin reductase family protein [Nitrospinota bacterium]|tara:strand:+ start:187 stop:825 length:639 start_codon:yes stop_codon:yes gene_type:complete
MSFRTIDPADIDRRQIYRLMVGTVVPRPIAWVSTVSKAGVANLAPFSFFTCVSHAPPMVSISMGERENDQKHTTRNIFETQGYVIHVVVNGMEEQMNICAGNYPPEVNEFEEAGLEAVPADLVPAPRIAAAPVAMECEFRNLLTNGEPGERTHLVIGEVIRWHIREDVMIDEKYIDPVLLQPVGRLAGNHYCRSQDVFEMQRPDRKPGQMAS